MNSLDGKEILKHKGLAKQVITADWFKETYKNLSKQQEITITTPFDVDYKQLKIRVKDKKIQLGLKEDGKRIRIFKDDVWVDTKPIHLCVKKVEDGEEDNVTDQIIKDMKREIEILKEHNKKLMRDMSQCFQIDEKKD